MDARPGRDGNFGKFGFKLDSSDHVNTTFAAKQDQDLLPSVNGIVWGKVAI